MEIINKVLINFFTIWNICLILSVILIFFRTDHLKVLSEIKSYIFYRALPLLILSLLLLYVFLPLTIPSSLRDIIFKDKKND
jgi:hypothetical protein